MIAILIILAWMGVIALVLCLFRGAAPRAECTQNCNQGRSCTCGARNSTHG